jgi:hypothetical protein
MKSLLQSDEDSITYFDRILANEDPFIPAEEKSSCDGKKL